MTPLSSHSRDTRSSLFSRIRAGEEAAWRELEDRYRPMLLRYCRRRNLQHFDAEDVVQRVFADLVRTLPDFIYDRKRGRFRHYLYTCVRNALTKWSHKNEQLPEQLGSEVLRGVPEDSRNGFGCAEDEVAWEEEWVDHHYRLAMTTVRNIFEARSVEIFDRSIAGATVSELAEAFSMKEDAVRKVRERIRDRMEELIAEQVREEDEIVV